MGKARDEAGNIWETDAQGNPVRLLSGGGQAPAIGQAIGNDPRMGSQVVKAANDAAASQYAPGTASAEQRIKEAEAANAKAVADAQARKAEADARIAEANASSGNAKAATTVRADAIKDYQTAQQLYGVIADLNQKFAAGPGSTTGVAGLRDFLPYTVNEQFDKAGNAARGIVGQALGFTGGQLNTQREAEQAVGPYLPQSGDRDSVIRDKIARLNDLAKTAESRAIATLGGRPDANGNIIPVTDKPEAAPNVPGDGQLPPDQLDQATGGTRTEVDEFRKGVMGRVSQMVTQGAPRPQVEKYLRDNGLDPNAQNLTQLYKFRGSPDFSKWQRANPGAILPLDPKYYTREVPMSSLRQNFNKAAASDLGGAAASYGVTAANALTGNRLDGLAENLGGNGQEVNSGLALLRAKHPLASTVGDASGQIMFDLLASRAPGLRSLAGMKYGQAGMDALYGGYAGQGDGNTLGGIAANVGGGMFGRAASKLGGAALRGVNSASAKYLNDAGVPLTIGQIGRGTDSMLGKGIAWTEDRLAGLPFADAIINAARRRGEVGFNEAAFKEAGGSGLTGSKGVDELGNKVSNAYSFLDGTSLPVDATFAGSQAAVRAGLPGLPSFGNEIGKGLDQIDRLGPVIPGRDWQSALRANKGDIASLKGQPFSDRAVDSLGDVQDNLLTLAERQGPPGTVDALSAANQLNGKYQTILNALDNGPTQARGELFSPTRLDAASRQGARNYGGRAKSMKGERPFYGLTNAGMDVMPNQVPDSGTSGRMLLAGALLPSILGGGAGAAYGGLSDNMSAGEGAAKGAILGTAIPTAGLAALYSKTGQKALQKLLLGNRGMFATKAADAVGGKASQEGLGATAAALLRRIYLYDQLPQN